MSHRLSCCLCQQSSLYHLRRPDHRLEKRTDAGLSLGHDLTLRGRDRRFMACAALSLGEMAVMASQAPKCENELDLLVFNAPSWGSFLVSIIGTGVPGPAAGWAGTTLAQQRDKQGPQRDMNCKGMGRECGRCLFSSENHVLWESSSQKNTLNPQPLPLPSPLCIQCLKQPNRITSRDLSSFAF